MTGKDIEGPALSAVSILFVVVAVLGLMVTMPFIYLGTLSSDVEARAVTIKKLQLQARVTSKSLRGDKEKTEQAGQGEKLLLTGDTTGIAGANLQRLVTDIVSRFNGKSRSFQILSPEKEKNLTRISMSLSIESDIDNFQKILHTLETKSPLIFIEDIVVRTKEQGGGNAFQKKKLEVTMKLSGYLLNRAAI